MKFLIALNNKNPKSDIEENAERSERRRKPSPPLTFLTSQQTREQENAGKRNTECASFERSHVAA
ncbi:hypothetical protein I79_024121 [Cricetulus griseus]|uniref:Uncharacterized protein n=1 Tax=Cricetulus griseus TaxID=10029 RepID=G3IJT4_CRIGR|nr:hypothetical protein I79_024121 [Cricetulus griseus]